MPNTKADPHWVRDTMIEDYRNSVIRTGKSPDMGQVARVVDADLRLCEHVWKEQAAKPKVKKKPRTDHAKIKEDAAKSGMKYYKTDANRPDVVDPFLDGAIDLKWQAALGRIREITKPQSMATARVLDVKMQKLALEFILAMDQLQRRRGEFAGKNAVDCRRIFRRKVEDICDRSTGKLGHWWVK